MAPEEQNPKLLSPLTLAFVGDGVYELLVRKKIVEEGNMPPKKLNARKVKMVRASTQAAVYDGLEPVLEEDEREILKRGRNAHTGSVPNMRKWLITAKPPGWKRCLVFCISRVIGSVCVFYLTRRCESSGKGWNKSEAGKKWKNQNLLCGLPV